MQVASQIEGRIRIRDEKLKSEAFLAQVRDALLETPGIDGVEANARVGSLLVLYTAAKTGVEKILDIISGMSDYYAGSDAAGPGANSCKTCCCERISLKLTPAMRRIATNIGMLASLGFSMLAAIFHLKKLHIITGLIFLLILGDHCLDRKERLFA